MKTYIQPEQLVPVIADTDAAVIGGSFAGIAAALRFADSGMRVALIEPRTYLGREMTATLLPWLGRETLQRADCPELIRHVASHAAAPSTADSVDPIPLHRDKLKIALEDIVLARGIKLIYASLPVDVLGDEDTITLVIANKSGRQAVRCSVIADMTETAIMRELLGATDALGGRDEAGEAYYFRTLEFDRVNIPARRQLAVPNELGIEGDSVRLLPGYAGEDQAYVMFALRLPAANTLAADHARERVARHVGMRLAYHLIQSCKPFHKANLCSASHELYGPLPSLTLPGESFSDSPASDAIRLAPGVWCAFADLYRSGNIGWLDPARAAELGDQLAVAAIDDLKTQGGLGSAITLSHRSPSVIEDKGDGESVQVRTPTFVVKRDNIVVRGGLLPVYKEAQIAVAGGGTSGATAAITAGREGSDTVLVEFNPGLGGTGTYGGVDSYWFGRRCAFAARNTDAVKVVEEKLHYKGHKWNIEAKSYALLVMAEEAGVDMLFGAITYGALTDGNRLCGIAAATRWGPLAVAARVTIDATGDGDVAAYAGADYAYGSAKDHAVMWYSLSQYASPSKIQNNFTSMVNVGDVEDMTRAILSGRRRGTDTHDHGVYIAPRESRHIAGDVTMRLTDQLLQRRWPDVVNIHFSNHDVKGVSGADWVNIGLIPPNLEIEIPYRMLLPKGLDGILVAGKAISATHDALPAIRMQADLENLGGVAALAAAEAIRTRVEPRAIDISRLQRRLVNEGLLPPSVHDRKLAPRVYSDEELNQLVDSIETDQPLYAYSNMRMNEVYEGTIPFVEICCAGPRIIPILERALAQSSGVRRIRLAQAMAMYESPKAAEPLIEAISNCLREGLQRRPEDIMYVQMPPDHGAMPEAANLLYALALCRSDESVPVWLHVAELLKDVCEEDFKDTWQGVFYYIESVCAGAERLGRPESVPALLALRRISLLNDQQCESGFQADYFPERRALLELALGRALARSGCADGYDVLIRYLNDSRAMLRKQALSQLRDLSGGYHAGYNIETWRNWLETASIQPTPYTSRLDMESNSESLLRTVVEGGHSDESMFD